MPKNNTMQTKDHIHGFDYGRGLFSILVVLWHTHAIGLPDVSKATASIPYRPTLIDLANFSILLTAVPFFMLASCYLYAMKGGGWPLFALRGKRLIMLGAFWSISYVVFASGYHGIYGLVDTVKAMPFRSAIYAFGTVYYFFIALAIVLALCEIARRTRGVATWIVFGLSCAAVPVMQWLALKYGSPAWAAHIGTHSTSSRMQRQQYCCIGTSSRFNGMDSR
ncbi:hypothetical protein [Cupriavidus pauculus]|uniref:hypothetical protein n=1 Tax=Cupriavidus pauculus TaxID=82633 RepID=UPI001D0BF9C4|nr:hypothetical protein [Cupriavidus pauculus]